MCSFFALECVIYLLFAAFGKYYATESKLSFRPVKHWSMGLLMCAMDNPTAVILSSDLVGISPEVPFDVQCGYACTRFSGCTSYNSIKQPVARCELFSFIPTNCDISRNTGVNCKHYEVPSFRICSRFRSSAHNYVHGKCRQALWYSKLHVRSRLSY